MRGPVLVKLGGSLITDKLKPYTVRIDVLNRLAKEIKNADNENIIVSHGQGSFGHQPAHKYQIHRGIINEKSYKGMSVVQDVAAQLNRIVVSSFLKSGVNAIGVQPSCSAICKNGRIFQWDLGAITQMLEKKQVPVPYGDIGFDLTRGLCIISADEIVNYFSRKMNPSRVIMVGKLEGVFTSDPSRDKNAEIIPEITTRNYHKIKACLTGSDGIDVTGGMLNKVESMLELAKKGIESEIISGEIPGNLLRSLKGEKAIGTIVRK